MVCSLQIEACLLLAQCIVKAWPVHHAMRNKNCSVGQPDMQLMHEVKLLVCPLQHDSSGPPPQEAPVVIAEKHKLFTCSFCSMARLDRVKNLSGLAEWFAANKRLRKLVNLVIVGKINCSVSASGLAAMRLCISLLPPTSTNVTLSDLSSYTVTPCDRVNAGGVVSPEDTTDHEEKEQCIKMHEIVNQYNLDGEFRYDSFTYTCSVKPSVLMHNSYSITAKLLFKIWAQETERNCSALWTCTYVSIV